MAMGLLRCPDEVLTRIVQSLELKEVQSFRLASRRCARVGNESLLAASPDGLCINITVASLRKLEGLVKHDCMAKFIKHIRFNAYVLEEMDYRIKGVGGLVNWWINRARPEHKPKQLPPPSIEAYVEAASVQRILLEQEVFFEVLTKLLTRCIRLESFELNATGSMAHFRRWIKNAFPELKPDIFLRKEMMKIDEGASSLAAGDMLSALRFTPNLATKLHNIKARGMPVRLKRWGAAEWGKELLTATLQITSTLRVLHLDFRYSNHADLSGKSTCWLLKSSTTFRSLQKLFLDHVIIEKDNMSKFLGRHRRTLAELQCGLLYFCGGDELQYLDFLKYVSKNLDLNDFSLGVAQPLIQVKAHEFVKASPQDFQREISVPAIGGGNSVMVKQKYIYRRLCCGSPFPSSAGKGVRKPLLRVDWSAVTDWNKVEHYERNTS